MLEILKGFKEARVDRVSIHEKLNDFKYLNNISKVIKGDLMKLKLPHEKLQPSHAKILASPSAGFSNIIDVDACITNFLF
jgi:hypothetical protein